MNKVFVEKIEQLYNSWRNYSDRVTAVEAGSKDHFDLATLKATSQYLYTRLRERLEVARELELELPDDHQWSWMVGHILPLKLEGTE